jgi:uncharacterized protein (TIGR02646 family)
MLLVPRPAPPQPHPFTTYKDPHVVAELRRLFDSRCAYCQTPVTAGSTIDVEHYRPKGSVLGEQGKVLKGYDWLELEWTNLLPSCIDCNRERWQEVQLADRTIDRRKTGKHCKFPLDPASRRARRRGEEMHEVPYLLDPCGSEDPQLHLCFTFDGSVHASKGSSGATSPFGFNTIEIVGLHRSGLVEWRLKRLQELETQMAEVCTHSWQALVEPKSVFHGPNRRRALERLRAMAADSLPYSAMARQAVRQFEELLAVLEPYLAVARDLRKRPGDASLQRRERVLYAGLQPFADNDHPWRELNRRVFQYCVGLLN